MMLIQIILFTIILLAFLLTWRRARQQAISRAAAIIWSLVWIGGAAVIWRPEVASTLARFVGIGRGVDLIVYGSIIMLLILVFQLHVAHTRLENELTQLVRQQALEKFEREKKSE